MNPGKLLQSLYFHRTEILSLKNFFYNQNFFYNHHDSED